MGLVVCPQSPNNAAREIVKAYRACSAVTYQTSRGARSFYCRMVSAERIHKALQKDLYTKQSSDIQKAELQERIKAVLFGAIFVPKEIEKLSTILERSVRGPAVARSKGGPPISVIKRQNLIQKGTDRCSDRNE
jgi:hypothetical protein